MKTNSMVWATVILLLMLGLGWYFWNQSSSSTITQTPSQTEETVPSQIQVTPSPTVDTAQPTATNTQATVPVGAAAPMAATVTYDGKKFSPASVTIAKGGTVSFINSVGKMWVAANQHPTHTEYDGTSRQQHCAAGVTPSFDQCIPGSNYSFTFNKTGSFDFHDHMNPAAEGKVIIK